MISGPYFNVKWNEAGLDSPWTEAVYISSIIVGDMYLYPSQYKFHHRIIIHLNYSSTVI